MNYLLDTCIISELTKTSPNRRVVHWCNSIPHECFYLSVLTFGELYKRIEKLSDVEKKSVLHDWIEYDLKEQFENNIIQIDMHIIEIWGKNQGKAEKMGKPMPSIDSLIAATGIAYNMTVVTRNIKDMLISGAEL